MCPIKIKVNIDTARSLITTMTLKCKLNINHNTETRYHIYPSMFSPSFKNDSTLNNTISYYY